MRVVLPGDAFSAPVPFTITRLDPAALPPEGNVDPIVAYAFEFGVPTLDSPAELSFAVRLNGLDQGTRDALLAGLADGRATLATRGAGAYQTFPLCAAGAAPTADGCVRAEHAGDVVRFTGVVGHFSTWAVAIVAKPPVTTSPTPEPKLTAAAGEARLRRAHAGHADPRGEPHPPARPAADPRRQRERLRRRRPPRRHVRQAPRQAARRAARALAERPVSRLPDRRAHAPEGRSQPPRARPPRGAEAHGHGHRPGGQPPDRDEEGHPQAPLRYASQSIRSNRCTVCSLAV